MPRYICNSSAIFAAGAALLLSSCGNGADRDAFEKQQAPRQKPVVVKSVLLPGIYEADQKLFERYPSELSAVVAPGADIDGQGLIGRNRSYGLMVSPRLQLGAGSAVRMGVHRADPAMARAGFRAIEAGTLAIMENGTVISKKPPDAPAAAVLSDGDKASGAAFFLSDACSGMLALSAAANADAVADQQLRDAVVVKLGRAANWLTGQTAALKQVDKAAPNRLLFDALAFQACGQLVGDAKVQAFAEPFVGMALAQTRGDGVFVEKGGSDTTYQAVAVRLSLDLLLSSYSAKNRIELDRAWQRGAAWLGLRIMADGRIDSTGNTRTCAGGESFLGAEKKVWPPSVYGALVYAGELKQDPQLADAAKRLAMWARANPRADPCFTR